jgi:hypothetical protein
MIRANLSHNRARGKALLLQPTLPAQWTYVLYCTAHHTDMIESSPRNQFVRFQTLSGDMWLVCYN